MHIRCRWLDYLINYLSIKERMRDLTSAVLSVLVPTYYIYAWIVIKSLFTCLGETQVHPANNLMTGAGTGYRRQPVKLVAFGVVRTGHGNNMQIQQQPQISPLPQPQVPWYVDSNGGQRGQQPLPSIYVQEPADTNRY